MNEIWKDIKGYEGIYQISDLGRVLNVKRGTLRKPSQDKDGYLQLSLSKNGKREYLKVHRLVAQAFINNPSELPFVNHLDENKKNNSVSNLEWCTQEYNNTYGSRAEKLLRKICKVDLHSDRIIKTYLSISSAAKEYRINPSSISHCLSGKRKSCVGYAWRYCD